MNPLPHLFGPFFLKWNPVLLIFSFHFNMAFIWFFHYEQDISCEEFSGHRTTRGHSCSFYSGDLEFMQHLLICYLALYTLITISCFVESPVRTANLTGCSSLGLLLRWRITYILTVDCHKNVLYLYKNFKIISYSLAERMQFRYSHSVIQQNINVNNILEDKKSTT
jgi:hypothetical protein